jgi:hypothetical protein
MLYQLSYRAAKARPGLEPGTSRLNVVPPAFAADLSTLATNIGESFLDPLPGPVPALNRLRSWGACHVLSPAFASRTF